MSTNSFFDESTEQSLVKATIVSKYFWAWAKVIMPTAKKGSGEIAYIDLFAGPGRYKDGTKSTPLLILEQAIQDVDMRNMLVTIFNDKDEENARSLENAINKLEGVDKMRFKPQVHNHEVGETIVRMFEGTSLIPTLFFVDPWGYKGFSLRLVNSVLKDWGCDCIFFFNYTRINMGLHNLMVQDHMNALFGEERADQLRRKLAPLDPAERELTIVEELSEALKEFGGKYVLPFRFKNNKGNRTSHHLIFVSKHPKGYQIMKGIMAKQSSEAQQGVASFEYNPASRIFPLLFELSRPRDELVEMLLTDFAGQTLAMREIYDRHNIGKPYIESNYKEVLKKLEELGKIKCEPPAEKRRKDTFANRVVVTFPSKGEL